MAKNDFKAFATDRSANVISQEEWEALPALLSGFTAGKASSAQVNKVIRQASFIAAALAQFVSDKTQRDVLDNGDLPGFVELLGSGFAVEYLSRKNPFGDIKSDGTVQTALENLGLGEAAKMPAATALASSAGNITIPVLIGGVQRTALLQWKTLSVPQSTDGNMVVVDGSWPVAFPNACLSINPSLVNSVIYATNGAPFVSAAIVDRVKFKAACAYTKSNSTVAVWGVGY